MTKKKKIAIFITTFILLVSGIKYKLYKDVSKLERKIKIKTEHMQNDDYFIVSHRGFSSLEVENTKEAIVLAADKDYIDAIEFDVRMTKDGKAIISHDNSLCEKLFKTTNVSSLTYEEAINKQFVYYQFPIQDLYLTAENALIRTREFDLNGRTYQLIGLSDAITACKDKIILVDLKFDNNYKELKEEIKNELENTDKSNIIFQSLDVEGIKYFQEHTNFNCQVLISSKEQLNYMNYFQNVGLNYHLVTYDIVDKLINEGKKVFIWTINSPQVLDKITKELGNHYQEVCYITNYPDLILTMLEEKPLRL